MEVPCTGALKAVLRQRASLVLRAPITSITHLPVLYEREYEGWLTR